MTDALTISSQFTDAVTTLRTQAKAQFDAAKYAIDHPLPDLPSDATPEQKKERAKKQETELAKAQGQMASAFKQLADIDKQELEAKGYAAIASLMITTSAAAEKLRLQIEGLIGTSTSATVGQPTLDEIDALGRVLAALAALSPAANWQKSGGTSGTSG